MLHRLGRALGLDDTEPVDSEPGPPTYTSWDDFLASTTEAERQSWCAAKANTANRPRLLAPRAEIVSDEDVWQVMLAHRGHCCHCGSLAVERRPSKPNGAPALWEHIGRRIGTLEHKVSRSEGGTNALANLAWACACCNTQRRPDDRRLGATDFGGHDHGQRPDPEGVARALAEYEPVSLAKQPSRQARSHAAKDRLDEFLETDEDDSLYYVDSPREVPEH